MEQASATEQAGNREKKLGMVCGFGDHKIQPPVTNFLHLGQTTQSYANSATNQKQAFK